MREPSPPVVEKEPARPLLTLRVSRDSGRTWGAEKRFYDRDCTPPLLNGVYPPCRCPRCRGGKS
ncbi:hypothetical protein OG946_20110 [Streptomyces sp. NBC_01808]|uniref:hypothetical protein n=1 Tax=Streptomyces sp. NBC_01808 TaxID=2975947 RepID=UPI002DDA93D1|nr:hypothetical protein [Streptomyces sp. NBC_01808]WSA39460.1 hypothetical protein OG946_20110 [Streptomyces sp. NBC_01808]